MKVFVSYSRVDRAAVRSLVDDLERARVQVWIDEELVGGDAWWTAVLEQVRGCEVFLFALSDKSLYSKPCRAELGYAQALRLPILPVEIGHVASRNADPIFAVQVVDYRNPTRDSAFDLISALHGRARLRPELPDPLPEPPRIPYEYLHRLGASIHDTTAALSPAVQAQMSFELRSAVSEEDDPIVLDDIRKLLLALRRRTDVTYAIAGEVDTFLRSEPTMSGEAAKDESRGGAVPSATGQRHDAPARRHRRRTILLAMAAVTLVVVAVVAYLVVTRTSSPHSTDAAAYNCIQVWAPMTSIEPRSDTEPRLRIPQPPGWEQSQMVAVLGDNRFELFNESLTATAVVSLTPWVEGGKVDEVFEKELAQLTSEGVTIRVMIDGTVCGLPAKSVSYTESFWPAHPVKMLLVADQAGDKTCLVIVSVRTRDDPADPNYKVDSETILTGLQVLPPGATG